MNELPSSPKVVGMYGDGRPIHDIEALIPYPGVAVQEMICGDKPLETALADYASWKAGFAADQARSLTLPTEIVDVGYVYDLDVGLILHFQYLYHGAYVAPPDAEGAE